MRRLLLVIVPLLIALTGCAKPEAALIGKWQFASETPKSGNARQDDISSKMASSFSLTFKADKTASMDLFGQSVPCTYEMSGKTVTLKVVPLPKAPAPTAGNDKPINLTLSDDGKTLTGADKGATGIQMKFTKS